MEREASASHAFRDVDATTQPATHVRYLQTVSALEQAQAYKRRSIDMLDIHPGARVLDVGCGVGDEVRLMAQRVGRDGRAVGIDSSAVMIAEAQKRSEGLDLPVEFRVGDIHRLDYLDETFDGCRVDRVLQHLDDPQRALGELVRVAKPGAPIVAAEPDWETVVVDLPDRALVRKVTHILCDHLVRNAWIGRQLYRHFQRAELIGLVAEPIWATFTDSALARNLMFLDAAADYGREHSLLAESEAAAWSEQIQAVGMSGCFFAAIFGFVVVGYKPDP
jgi:ubiquinone/menaquinone biosynthesis C-methylase UbiE